MILTLRHTAARAIELRLPGKFSLSSLQLFSHVIKEVWELVWDASLQRILDDIFAQHNVLNDRLLDYGFKIPTDTSFACLYNCFLNDGAEVRVYFKFKAVHCLTCPCQESLICLTRNRCARARKRQNRDIWRGEGANEAPHRRALRATCHVFLHSNEHPPFPFHPPSSLPLHKSGKKARQDTDDTAGIEVWSSQTFDIIARVSCL